MTLTFDGHYGAKVIVPIESPYAVSYLTSIDTNPVSRTVLEIFQHTRLWAKIFPILGAL